MSHGRIMFNHPELLTNAALSPHRTRHLHLAILPLPDCQLWHTDCTGGSSPAGFFRSCSSAASGNNGEAGRRRPSSRIHTWKTPGQTSLAIKSWGKEGLTGIHRKKDCGANTTWKLVVSESSENRKGNDNEERNRGSLLRKGKSKQATRGDGRV